MVGASVCSAVGHGGENRVGASMKRTSAGFGGLIKLWRETRRLSQEALALDAEISARHLSCLETGKARPSREMVLVLASALELQLRDRNTLLTTAGFAPVYASKPLESLELAPVRRAVELILEKQEPYGAVLVDRLWNVLQLNRGAAAMVTRFLASDADPALTGNLVKGILHPKGLRPALVNWVEVAAFTVARLRHECAAFPHDPARQALLEEVTTYPGVATIELSSEALGAPPMATVHLRRGADEARFFTMLTTVGTPLDVTAQELAIESYFPADEATERWCAALG